MKTFFFPTIGLQVRAAFVPRCGISSVQAQLSVMVVAPKPIGQKTVVELEIRRQFAEWVEAAKAVVENNNAVAGPPRNHGQEGHP